MNCHKRCIQDIPVEAHDPELGITCYTSDICKDICFYKLIS